MLTRNMVEYYYLGPLESWDLSQVEEETLCAFFCLEVLGVPYLWHWYLNHSYVSMPVLLHLSLVWHVEYLKRVSLKTLWSQGFHPDSAHSYLHFFSVLVFLSIVGDTVEELVKASMSSHCSVVTKHLSFKAAPSQPVTWKEFTHLASKKVIYATGLGRFSK